jgi:hypothetical protein
MLPFKVSLTIEPEPGRVGDPRVLAALVTGGMKVEPVDGTNKMRIAVPGITAASSDAAADQARERVRKLVPQNGYLLSEPEAVYEPAGEAAQPGRIPATAAG